MTEKRVIPWAEIRKKYEAGEGSYATLARCYGISSAAIGKRARRENWRGRRGEPSIDACLLSAVQQLRRGVEEAVEGREDVSVKELKELTGMLRELMNLEQAVAQREEETEKALRIIMEEDIESCSR